MINALILNSNPIEFQCSINKKIESHYPEFNISCFSFSDGNCLTNIKKNQPEIIFCEIENSREDISSVIPKLNKFDSEIIFITSKKEFIHEVIQYNLSGYLLKPINYNSFKSTVDIALKRIIRKKGGSTSLSRTPDPSSHQVIGVPTMEGYEFLAIQDIIRCESYLKCTRVITSSQSDIISSYNIGEFSKQLGRFGFYAPHQSYLINLCKVKKYLKEGNIIMSDNSAIPVARRRRIDFLKQIPHL